MDALTTRIREAAAEDPALADLFRRHLGFTRATSPACSVHSREATELAAAGARLFVIETAAGLVAMGALVRIGPGHGEIKSMHVAESDRGRGHGQRILAQLIETARAAGLSRLSLETGSQPAFAPARALYARAGFRDTGPFGSYEDDPNSVYMTLDL